MHSGTGAIYMHSGTGAIYSWMLSVHQFAANLSHSHIRIPGPVLDLEVLPAVADPHHLHVTSPLRETSSNNGRIRRVAPVNVPTACHRPNLVTLQRKGIATGMAILRIPTR